MENTFISFMVGLYTGLAIFSSYLFIKTEYIGFFILTAIFFIAILMWIYIDYREAN